MSRIRSVVVAVSVALLLLGSVVPIVAAKDEVAGPPDVMVRVGSGLSKTTVRVPEGAVVGFRNTDGERHRLRSRSEPDGFDTGDIDPGEMALIRFDVAGTFVYLDERDEDDRAYQGRIVVGAAGEGSGSGGGGPGGAAGEAGAGTTAGAAPSPTDPATGPEPSAAVPGSETAPTGDPIPAEGATDAPPTDPRSVTGGEVDGGAAQASQPPAAPASAAPVALQGRADGSSIVSFSGSDLAPLGVIVLVLSGAAVLFARTVRGTLRS